MWNDDLFDDDLFDEDLILEDLYGFLPGLRPRTHETLPEAVADRLEEAILEASDLDIAEYVRARGEDPEDPAEVAEQTREVMLDAVRRRQEHRPSRLDGPEASRNVRRLGAARKEIEDFETTNRYQRHLQGLLSAMLDHMEENCCQSGEEKEFRRWWSIVGEYARVLTSPEMATRRARTVMEDLLG